jgi:methionyl aminopeptidase
MDKQTTKTTEEIKIMTEGGRILRNIRDMVAAAVKPGVKTIELEKMANKIIEKAGGKPSFKMVPGYHWATCINLNDVVVHGIPGETVIREEDKVGIDVGLFYKGFHTDTATTVIVNSNPTSLEASLGARSNKFLDTGRLALKRAIGQARPGKRVADISEAIQKTVETAGYSAVRALTGHGLGRNLHEEPAIPCFVVGEYEHSPILLPGMVLAIEVMYNEGGWEVVYKNDDGWTISTADGKISGLFEQTVAITQSGPVVLT